MDWPIEMWESDFKQAKLDAYQQGREDAIADFVKRLLNNRVIDRSVVRRIAAQMKEKKDEIK